MSKNQNTRKPDELFEEAEFDRLVTFSKNLDDTSFDGKKLLEKSRSVDALPQTFGQHELTRMLGQGSTGSIYLAVQRGTEQVVAVKKISSTVFGDAGSATIEKRLQEFREQSRAAAIVGPNNIVEVYDVGEVDGQYYYSMRYVDGRCLAKLILANTFSNREAAGTAKTIAQCVHQLHKVGIFHRRLNVSNILLDREYRPHILELGVSALQPLKDGDLPAEISFTPPEIVSGSQTETPASQVWSIGAILYNCLVGEAPFSSRIGHEDGLQNLLKRDPEPPRKRNPTVAPGLEAICLKCLRKNPANRFESAGALAEELDRFIEHQPIETKPPGLLQRSWNKVRGAAF